MAIRQGLHRLGLRYRIHGKKLAGRPDLVFTRFNAVVFVHGCFWHGHDCHFFKWPMTRTEFWRAKIELNRSRDARQTETLRHNNWRVCIVWECAIKGTGKDIGKICNEIADWVRSDSADREITG